MSADVSLDSDDPRVQARWRIIQSVNQAILKDRRTPQAPRMYGMKQIQRVIFIARQRRLVTSEQLVAAGYNGRVA